MKKTLKNLFLVSATISSLSLQGCTTPHRNEGISNLIMNNVVRMYVNWGEYPDKAWSPASYNVAANYYHWNENSIQYRWIWPQANLRRDLYGVVNEMAMVPDEIPFLRHGDLVDVYLPPFETYNYGEMRAPIVIRFVCSADDDACQDKSKKELGGKNEVVSKGKPDLSGFTFTKKFDKTGKRLVPLR
ncbi:hypothetical protein GTP56_05445 [Duganella sp. FT134W]|uniref:Uncharacterized protein n=1 Tax=Duganella margarita TaxID=2692170 RepID=A0A7X4GXP3_9BURK|nr:hypothetical protein [Duganella margarita]MYM71640.1 hypothetical protein [Duganella margarita]